MEATEKQFKYIEG